MTCDTFSGVLIAVLSWIVIGLLGSIITWIVRRVDVRADFVIRKIGGELVLERRRRSTAYEVRTTNWNLQRPDSGMVESAWSVGRPVAMDMAHGDRATLAAEDGSVALVWIDKRRKASLRLNVDGHASLLVKAQRPPRRK